MQLYHAWIVRRRLEIGRVKCHIIKPCILMLEMTFRPLQSE